MIRSGLAIGFFLVASAAPAAAQSMWPLLKEGVTYTDRKAVYLTVLNPYPKAMVYVFEAFEPDYTTPVTGAKVVPSKVNLGPEGSRRVMLVFEVPDGERTVSVCVRPEKMDGRVMPRVCGRYTGRRAGGGDVSAPEEELELAPDGAPVAAPSGEGG